MEEQTEAPVRVLNAFEEAAADLASRKEARREYEERMSRIKACNTNTVHDFVQRGPCTTSQVAAHFNIESRVANAMLRHLCHKGKATVEKSWCEASNRFTCTFTPVTTENIDENSKP